MFSFRVTILVLGLLLFCVGAVGQERVFHIGVFQDQLQFYDVLLDENGCAELDNAKLDDNQVVFEYLLFCNLVKAKVPEAKFRLIGFPVVARIVNALDNGHVDASGFGIWQGESERPGTILSNPLLRKGEFNKGLFVKQQTLDEYLRVGDALLPQLIAVSNKNWTYDWRQLDCSPLNVTHVDTYSQMFKIVELGRADVLPIMFGSRADLSRSEYGITLHALPGKKLVIPDSSHFVFASQSAEVHLLVNIINAGLADLRDRGMLLEWYNRIGVFHPEVRDWQPICPPQRAH